MGIHSFIHYQSIIGMFYRNIVIHIGCDILIDKRRGAMSRIELFVGLDSLLMSRVTICQYLHTYSMHDMSTVSTNSCTCDDNMEVIPLNVQILPTSKCEESQKNNFRCISSFLNKLVQGSPINLESVHLLSKKLVYKIEYRTFKSIQGSPMAGSK